VDAGDGLGIWFSLLLFVVIPAMAVGGTILWIVALVEILRIPDHEFRVARTEKVMWVLVVALASWIGALIWYFTVRRSVLAAAGQVPPPPPGWYPEPATGAWRWWDGRDWAGPPHTPGHSGPRAGDAGDAGGVR
jgi:hypothetical protein